MLGLCPIPGTELLKPLEFLSDESSHRGGFVMLTRWLLESPWVPEDGGCWLGEPTRGLEGWNSRRGQGPEMESWNRLPVASGLVSHVYEREPP